MTSEQIQSVQMALKASGLYNGKVDGISGPMTTSSIREFQRRNHLVDDGIAGPKTWAALFPADAPIPKPDPNVAFWSGNAKRMEPGDIERISNDVGLPVTVIKAFLMVESAGKPFDEKNRPTALYEPHLAYRFSSGNVRNELLDAGIAYAKWGTKPYPKSSDERYQQISLCASIGGDELAADSTSWGVPQICGFNAKASGYVDGVSMVRAFAADEENQMAAMGAFIMNNSSLYQALKRLDWDHAAELYNGAAYRKNNYAIKLASAYKQALKG